MKCPFCKHLETMVIDSRVLEEGDTVKRRRRCNMCGRRFTTFEHTELSFPVVVKKNGSRVDYEHNKLRNSMKLALRKRPVAAQAVDEAMIHIEEKLLSSGVKEISSDRLGEWVMQALQSLDKIAYIRFASVYKSFEDVSEFGEMLQTLTPPHS